MPETLKVDGKMNVHIISPTKSVLDDVADKVLLPTPDGNIMILKDRAPLFTATSSGIMWVYNEGVKPVALNEKLSWDFVNTDKTPEEIKATLTSLGYSVYESVSGEERVINIVSADGREYMNLTVLPVGMVDKDAFCGNLEDYEEYLNSTGLLGGNERFIFSYSETSGYAMLLASNTVADEHWAKISK